MKPKLYLAAIALYLIIFYWAPLEARMYMAICGLILIIPWSFMTLEQILEKFKK